MIAKNAEQLVVARDYYIMPRTQMWPHILGRFDPLWCGSTPPKKRAIDCWVIGHCSWPFPVSPGSLAGSEGAIFSSDFGSMKSHGRSTRTPPP